MNKVPQKYRVIRELVDEGDDGHPPTYSYTIREVHYLEDGTPHVFSEETIPYGTTRMELQEDLLRMINALIHPVLNEDLEEVEQRNQHQSSR